MLAQLTRVADLWVGRRARPDPTALAAVADKKPATVVTGASRGIGFALAMRFAEGGDTVVIVARDGSALQSAGETIAQRTGRPVERLVLDIADPAAPPAIDTFLSERGLYLDTLINNAGTGIAGRFADQAPERIENLVAVNVAAVTRLTRHALPQMLRRGRGGILNVASLGGYVPGPYQAAYYASKAFVLSLTEAVGEECAGEGVRVAALAPGPTQTRFHADKGATRALYVNLLPLASPESVARAAYRGFKLGRRVILPGVGPPVFAYLVRVLPRPVARKLLATLLKI